MVSERVANTPERIVEDSAGNRFALRARPCPVCGEDETKVLGMRGGRYQRYGQGIENRIVQCRSCRLVFPDPFPYPLNPDALYGDPDGYFGETDLERRIEAHRGLVLQILKRANRHDVTILDVGAGRGEFLAAAEREGVRAVGIEPMKAMVFQGRERLGVEIHCETIEEFEKHNAQSFDVVTLSGVLEHVHDPNSLVASIVRVSQPGALLYVDVPREPNLLSILGNAWNSLKGNPAVYNLLPTWPPYHVLGFNPRSLGVLLSKNGFRVEELRVHASPHVPSRDEWRDRMRAFVASQIHRVGNYTGLAANMFVWARRRD
jgi:SAM-dependent methyltransferase